MLDKRQDCRCRETGNGPMHPLRGPSGKQTQKEVLEPFAFCMRTLFLHLQTHYTQAYEGRQKSMPETQLHNQLADLA